MMEFKKSTDKESGWESHKAMMKKRLQVARGEAQADMVLKGGKVLNVYTREWQECDIAIVEGHIAGMGQYSAANEVDMAGKWLVPGFIDAHVHMESAMVTPRRFAEGVLPKGTTSIVADPHEIANVMGVEGIRLMIEESRKTQLDVFMMLPSCVPATPFEHSGAVLGADELAGILEPEIIGLGEMMDFVGAAKGDDGIIEKVMVAPNGFVDGHGPGLSGGDLQAYVALGVNTDHECTNVKEMKEKIRLGQYVLMREGSAARNVRTLCHGIDQGNKHRVMLCTDDKHPGDIIGEGHIDYAIRALIEEGIDPLDAYTIASHNAAMCYNLRDRGALSPGKLADVVVLDDVNHVVVSSVYKRGVLVETDKEWREAANGYFNSVHLAPLSTADLQIPMTSDIGRVIKLIDFELVTENVLRKVDVKDGFFKTHPKLDILKLAVVERHKASGNVGLGLIEGYNLKGGAIGTSVAHDSHNLIIVGDDDADMVLVAKRLQEIGGGIVVVSKGAVIGEMPLPLAGLMSDQSMIEVHEQLEGLHRLAHENLGVSRRIDPFMTLAFMALPVIPSLKLTDMGLFDVDAFTFTSVNVNE